VLAGAVPAACLALAVDGLLLVAERLIAPGHVRTRRLRRSAAAVLIVALGALVAWPIVGRAARTEEIRIGSKNFTEQIILGELLAQVIERETGLPVRRRLDLGGTFICDRALRAGEIDVYVEYTGTADTAVFKNAVETDPGAVLARVRQLYADAGITTLPPLGFDNTFAILVRGDDARRLHLTTIEDAAAQAPRWRAGFGYEFLERRDGYPGLAEKYGLTFAAPPTAMDLSLIYRALAQHQVDLIAGDATSGLIAAYDLAMLKDSRQYFPPYAAVPVARSAMLLRHPEVRRALESLAGRISVTDMRRMNYAVDAGREDPVAVVRAFLNRQPMKG